MKFSSFQYKEFSKYWFDISKIIVASLVVKFFEPEAKQITFSSLATIFVGLTLAFIFVILGLKLSKEVKE